MISTDGRRERKVKIDAEFRELIDPLSGDEREKLKASILDHGCREPLTVWKETGILLDGHARYEICLRHGIPYSVARISLPDRDAAKLWIIKHQCARHGLSEYERMELIMKAEQIRKEQAADAECLEARA